jgi:hypothetical protein
MLTIFTTPKPFRGHIDVIQRNALRSWTMLTPRPEIIVFGDELGATELAAESSIRHAPTLARNEYGTPLVSDLFARAEHFASHDVLAYVNADIVLMDDFMRAIAELVRRKRKFLMVGQRFDLDVADPMDFQGGWQMRLKSDVALRGNLHPASGIDYFAFRRGLWGNIPDFAIGRTSWDNWLVYAARAARASVVDATAAVMVVHQNHDYSHAGTDADGLWAGPEARRNLELAEGHRFTLADATHELGPHGLRRAPSGTDSGQRLDRLLRLHTGIRALTTLPRRLWRLWSQLQPRDSIR